MITAKENIQAAINDCQLAVASNASIILNGTFVTALACLISVAEDYIGTDNSDDKADMIEALESSQYALSELEDRFNQLFGHISDAEDAATSMESDFDDAKSEINDVLKKFRGYS